MSFQSFVLRHLVIAPMVLHPRNFIFVTYIYTSNKPLLLLLLLLLLLRHLVIASVRNTDQETNDARKD